METVLNTLVGFLISFGVLTPSTDTPPPSTDDEVANVEYSVDENRFEELKLAIETITELEEELDEAGEKLDLDGDGIINVIEDNDDSDDNSDDDSDDEWEDKLEGERGLGSIFLADNLADRIRGWDNMSERAKQRLQELKELKAREIIEDIEGVVEEEIVEDVIDEIVEEVIDEIEDIDDINDEFEVDIKLAQAQIEEADTGTAREEALQHLESVLEQRQAATETARQAYSREATESIRELIPAGVQDRLPAEAIEAIENVTERVAERRAEAQARSDNALANAQERDNEAQERADERAREAQNQQNERGQGQPNR